MSINAGQLLYHLLSNDSGVTDLVATRIYPVTAPQNAVFPYVVYQIISSTPYESKDRPADIDKVRMQIDCYAQSTATAGGYDQCEDIQAAIRAAIDGVTPGTYNSVETDGIAFETENEVIVEEIDIYRRSADYSIRIKH